MPRLRRMLVGAVAVIAVACGSCTPGAGPTTPTPGQSSPGVDYTQPGAARAALDALQQASGQSDAIKVELSQSSAVLVVVDGTTAKTWTYRDGKPTEVDGDTQYVGQARFKLADYDLDDVGALFRQAASSGTASASSSSKNPQQLQIVEYSGGRVYMTVTTSPETQTIFFTADGSMVPTLDLTSAAGLATGLTDAIGTSQTAYDVTISPSVGVSVDSPGDATAPMIRSVRAPKFPTRVELRGDKPTSSLQFDPHDVDPDVLADLVQRYGADKKPVSFVIDRRDGLLNPTIRVSADGRTLVCDLAGNDITASVKK